MAQNKKLTLSVVKKQDAKVYGAKKKVDVNGYDFIVDTVFRPSSTNNLLREFISDIEYFRTNNIDFANFDVAGYMGLLIIKHFSDFEVPDDVSLKVQTLRLLIDGDFFVHMLNAFDSNEVKKISDRIGEFTNLMKEGIEKAMAELKEQENSEKEE